MSPAVRVTATGAAGDAVETTVPSLVEARFATRLFARDPTLWGPGAEQEAARRLSWVGLAETSRALVHQVTALRELHLADGLDHVVLCGMGGSSLAPEVICAAHGVELTVLDSSHPDTVGRVTQDRLDRAVVVVSSKSGSTLETDSQKRAFEAAFARAGIDPTERIVVVTDPGSPLEEAARASGYRVVNADPDVGGRYSALTAFGLVPSGLAGADIARLLDEAESVVADVSADDAANPALRLGAAIAGTSPLRDKLVLVDDGSGLTGLPDWAEQLLAESTGKQQTGVLPVVVQDDTAPEAALPPHDVTVARLVPRGRGDGPSPTGGSDITVAGPLGGQLLLWEAATAVAGRVLGINPFDQPDVESAKSAARDLLDGAPPRVPTAFTEGPVEVRAPGDGWLGDAHGVGEAVRALTDLLGDRGYLAVMAYLDRDRQAPLASVRRALAIRTARPTTFGWGPRFLHSTGQFHKGGPPVGVYLQITAEPSSDLAVPGRDFGFGALIAAQAAGDAHVLAEHGRPVLRLHLTDAAAGIAALLESLR